LFLNSCWFCSKRTRAAPSFRAWSSCSRSASPKVIMWAIHAINSISFFLHFKIVSSSNSTCPVSFRLYDSKLRRYRRVSHFQGFPLGCFLPSQFSSCTRFRACCNSMDTAPSCFARLTSSWTNLSLFIARITTSFRRVFIGSWFERCRLEKREAQVLAKPSPRQPSELKVWSGLCPTSHLQRVQASSSSNVSAVVCKSWTHISRRRRQESLVS